MNLQEKIDQTEEYGILVLDFNEYFTQIVINKPITIDGQNSTICAKKGPVISINSDGVELRNLRAEVTTETKEKNASFALMVQENIRVRLENIIVKGNVSGLVMEDGEWEYPDALRLCPVIPNKKNYFVFDMNIPISCVLETDISGLRIVNPGLKIPGYNRVSLEVENLKKDIVLFGQIAIISPFLTRIIAVSGGSFGVSEKTPNPDKEKPIHVGKKLDSPEPERSKNKKKAREQSEPVWIKKAFIAMALILCLIAAVFFSISFFKSSKRQGDDTIRPTGNILEIKTNYTEGESVSLVLNAEDNQSVRKIEFKVENSSVNELWDVKGQSVAQKYSFSTKGWQPGVYDYSFLVADEAENSNEYKGRFELREPPDTTLPTGEINGIKDSYTQGDMVSYVVRANDNKSLKKITFTVKDSTVETSWMSKEKSVTYNSSFSTKEWKPGTYAYSLLIEDNANNSKTYSGNFILKEVEYGEVNILTRPWTEIYIDGKSFGNTPVWKLKLPAGRTEIRFVNKSQEIDIIKTIVVKPNDLTKESFTLK